MFVWVCALLIRCCLFVVCVSWLRMCCVWCVWACVFSGCVLVWYVWLYVVYLCLSVCYCLCWVYRLVTMSVIVAYWFDMCCMCSVDVFRAFWCCVALVCYWPCLGLLLVVCCLCVVVLSCVYCALMFWCVSGPWVVAYWPCVRCSLVLCRLTCSCVFNVFIDCMGLLLCVLLVSVVVHWLYWFIVW